MRSTDEPPIVGMASTGRVLMAAMGCRGGVLLHVFEAQPSAHDWTSEGRFLRGRGSVLELGAVWVVGMVASHDSGKL